MTIKVNANYARQHLDELLNCIALSNEEILIERAGKAIAKIVRASDPMTKKGKGTLDFRKAAGLGSELWSTIDIDDYLNKERGE